MQDKNHSECHDEKKKDKTEAFQEQYLPRSYDWRQSNCDEKRTVPCQRKNENIIHKYH